MLLKCIKTLRKCFVGRMKKDIVDFVYACLTWQKSNIENQKPLGLMQPLDIPGWKWDSISMDFEMSLPKTSKGNDSVWVRVDTLNKYTHFISIK